MSVRVLVACVALVALVHACTDTSEDCGYYKESGYCESYKDTMLDMCAKTCGFCAASGGGVGGDEEGGGEPAVDPRPDREPESPQLCRDTCNTKDCKWFKSQDHCEKYSAVMVANCASTCGWCGAKLCKPPAVENGWTDFEMTMVPSGASVNVFCYDNHKNMGSAQLTCNSYGEMEGQARCEKQEEEGMRSTVETACQRTAKAATEPAYKDGQYVIPQASTHYVAQCDDYNGNYKEFQYDGSKGETFCVDVYQGNEVQGTRIRGKHDYISCAPGAAKEYYERLAQEKAYAEGRTVQSYNENTESASDASTSGYGYEDSSDSYPGYDQYMEPAVVGGDDTSAGYDSGYDDYYWAPEVVSGGESTYDYNAGVYEDREQTSDTSADYEYYNEDSSDSYSGYDNWDPTVVGGDDTSAGYDSGYDDYYNWEPEVVSGGESTYDYNAGVYEDGGQNSDTSADYGYYNADYNSGSGSSDYSDYYGVDTGYGDDSSDYYGVDSGYGDDSSGYYGVDTGYGDDSSDYYGIDSGYGDDSSDYYGVDTGYDYNSEYGGYDSGYGDGYYYSAVEEGDMETDVAVVDAVKPDMSVTGDEKMTDLVTEDLEVDNFKDMEGRLRLRNKREVNSESEIPQEKEFEKSSHDDDEQHKK